MLEVFDATLTFDEIFTILKHWRFERMLQWDNTTDVSLTV